MRENLPVTQKEYIVDEDTVLISKTDTQSHIIYANSSFVKVSGFDYDELLGAPHNIVRHPDMPAEIFKDMWSTLHKGETWQGVVKNRRKNGDHYWIKANTSPIHEGNRIVGYASVRTKASQEEIQKAESIYKTMRKNPGRLTIRNGRVSSSLGIKRIFSFNYQSITSKLIASGVISSALTASMLAGAIVVSDESRRSINEINSSYVSMMEDLYEFEQLVTNNRRQINVSLSGSDRKIDGKIFPEFERNIDKTFTAWEDIYDNHLIDNSANNIDNIDSAFKDLMNNGILKTAKIISSGDYDLARETFSKALRSSAVDLSRLMEEEIYNAVSLASSTADQAIEKQDRLILYIILLAVLSGATLLLVFYKVIKSIRSPLSKAKTYSLQVAAGNLSSDGPKVENNEIGDIINNMNLVKKSLNEISKEISSSVSSVVPAIDSILENNTSMASRIEQQAAAVQETAASMEEITSIISNSAENANAASTVSLENVGKVEVAEGAIEDMTSAMEEIRQQTKSMEEMINIIDGIAFQTNILALNASVEAARAGENGRGFSVVAQEVRNLASKSAEAAKAIQASIESTVESVEKGANYSTRTVNVMSDISMSSSKVNDLMSEISASAKEQEHGVSQIGQAISEIDRATQESSHAMNEYANSTLSLKSEAYQLDRSTEAFESTEKLKSEKQRPKSPAVKESIRIQKNEDDWSAF